MSSAEHMYNRANQGVHLEQERDCSYSLKLSCQESTWHYRRSCIPRPQCSLGTVTTTFFVFTWHLPTALQFNLGVEMPDISH